MKGLQEIKRKKFFLTEVKGKYKKKKIKICGMQPSNAQKENYSIICSFHKRRKFSNEQSKFLPKMTRKINTK